MCCVFLFDLELDVPEYLSLLLLPLADPPVLPLQLVPLPVDVLRGRCVLLALPGKSLVVLVKARFPLHPDVRQVGPAALAQVALVAIGVVHNVGTKLGVLKDDAMPALHASIDRLKNFVSARTSAHLKLGMRHHSGLVCPMNERGRATIIDLSASSRGRCSIATPSSRSRSLRRSGTMAFGLASAHRATSTMWRRTTE